MAVQSMERLIGIRTLDYRKNFSADFMRGDAITNQRELVESIAVRIEGNVFKKSPTEALEDIKHRLNLASRLSADVDSTTMALYRPPNTQQGDPNAYFGYSLQQEIEAHTARGVEVSVAWFVRALETRWRNRGIGRFDIQEGLIRHQRARSMVHRTIVPASPKSIGSILNGTYLPYTDLYDRDPDDGRRGIQIMIDYYFKLKEAGIARSKNPPNYSTGVAIADAGPNLAYTPKANDEPQTPMEEYMTRVLKAEPGGTKRIYGVAFIDSPARISRFF